MRVAVVAGTRPNFVKVGPVLRGLRAHGADPLLVHTGQHWDHVMSQGLFDDLGLAPPDIHLETESGSQARQTGSIMVEFEAALDILRAEAVVVLGDVNSTLACALVAAKAGIPLAHVEAGLRSRNRRMPEEINRLAVDSISDLLLAPSEDAMVNLRDEGCPEDRMRLVGNVMVDTLLANVNRASERPLLADLGVERGQFAAATLHRPENVDNPLVLSQLLDGIRRVAKELPVVFPVHPRVADRIPKDLADDNVILIGPLGYLDFVCLQDAAALVLTDSGGVQEETTILGTPCLTLRTETERPITVTHGTNTLAGLDPETIHRLAKDRLNGCPVMRPPGWDGHAGDRCGQAVVGILDGHALAS